MAQVNLTCRTIGDLKGGAAERVIDETITQVVADLEDRGWEDKKPRKVVITIDMLKHTEEMTLIDVIVKADMPPRKVPTTTATSKRRLVGGMPVDDLQFQSANPENPRQGTFPEMDVAGGEVAHDA